MSLQGLKVRIKKNPKLKYIIWKLIMHPVKARPRRWFRMFQPFYMHRGKRSVIYRSVRKDIVPFNQFFIGSCSVVEDFSTIANAVGDIIIGNNTRIGLGNTVIGPVEIGSNVNLAQNITVTGLNHNYQDITTPISEQGVSTSKVFISDNVWIGANSVILPGVNIGNHSVIGAGSVVTRDIPPYSIALGNPAKVIKKYDLDKKDWLRC